MADARPPTVVAAIPARGHLLSTTENPPVLRPQRSRLTTDTLHVEVIVSLAPSFTLADANSMRRSVIVIHTTSFSSWCRTESMRKQRTHRESYQRGREHGADWVVPSELLRTLLIEFSSFSANSPLLRCCSASVNGRSNLSRARTTTGFTSSWGLITLMVTEVYGVSRTGLPRCQRGIAAAFLARDRYLVRIWELRARPRPAQRCAGSDGDRRLAAACHPACGIRAPAFSGAPAPLTCRLVSPGPGRLPWEQIRRVGILSGLALVAGMAGFIVTATAGVPVTTDRRSSAGDCCRSARVRRGGAYVYVDRSMTRQPSLSAEPPRPDSPRATRGGADRDRGQVEPGRWMSASEWGVERAVADVPTRVWIWWAMAVVCWPAVLTC